MDPVVTFLLETLKDEVVSTSKKLSSSGARNQISTLHDDLNYLKSVLEKWTEHPIEENEQKTLMKQLREAVYDAEDILADLVAEETRYKNRSIIRKMTHMSDHASKLLSAARKIDSLKQKVEDIHKRKNYAREDGRGMGSIGSSTTPKMIPTVEEENVVGFDGEAETVIKLLTTGSDDLEVITIVGMPGLGKTTLAKMISRNSSIEYEFYNRVWVYVSKDCNVREVFVQILSQFTKVTNEMHEMNTDKLADEVKKNLEREKYLIVMDDVWEPKDWNALQKAFPKNKKNSRILITSRNESVGKHANPHRDPHRLKFLNQEESCKLLNIKALGSEICPQEDLARLGSHIADECGGLPLALVVIGGILREKGLELEHWRNVSKNVTGYIKLDSEQSMKKLIAWSFYQLPYSLKACFLYLGMFPEGSPISATRLIRMWIAEGFIREIGDMSLENIAEEYLEYLVKRNLVIIGEFRSNGKIKTCHVHDMIRTFCTEIAAEENIYHEVKEFDPSTYPSPNLEFKNYRRICIHFRVLNYINSDYSMSLVRSFSCSSKDEITLPNAQVNCIPKKFKLLRVLDGKPIAFPIFPPELQQLVHLKYIVLSIKFKILPETISNLLNLQTLIVHTTSRTLEIKGDYLKMLKLRHLVTNASTSWSALSKARDRKEELVKNENLMTLSTISPENCTEDAFDRVPKINKLGIRGQLAKILNSKDKSCSLCSFDNVMKLKSVKSLRLINDVLGVSDLEGEIIRLPNGFPPSLNKLTLTNTQLDWLDMSTLGKLENLEILKLKENSFKGKYWDSKPGEFRALKILLVGRTDLHLWQASGDHFPKLKRLSLHHCTYLKDVPSGLASFPSLEMVELFWTTTVAAASAKRIRNELTDSRQFKLSIYPPDHDL